jgi:pantoate--beta-alanine ligase
MAVKIMTKPAQMQKASQAWKKKGLQIALVPTMGALHEGHLALIRRAVALADRVVVSAYVNPTQFNSRADLQKYPYRPGQDAALAKQAGADLLFRPLGLYAKDASTWVEEKDCSRGRCGDRRPGHFRGVATVVTKLFHLVQPDVAVFGDKDRQQCEVMERMVRDLFFPVRIVRHAVVREKDGLPRSSRNSRLNSVQRRTAGSWARALAEAAREGKGRAVSLYRQKLKKVPGARHEYVETHGGQLYAAVRVGGVRLIDHRPCGRSR